MSTFDFHNKVVIIELFHVLIITFSATLHAAAQRQAHPPPAGHDQAAPERASWKNDNTAVGRVQRLVVLLLVSSRTNGTEYPNNPKGESDTEQDTGEQTWKRRLL
jgi:hypothetical protein